MIETFTKGGVSNKDNSSIIHLPKIFNRQPYENVGFDNDQSFFVWLARMSSDLDKEAINLKEKNIKSLLVDQRSGPSNYQKIKKIKHTWCFRIILRQNSQLEPSIIFNISNFLCKSFLLQINLMTLAIYHIFSSLDRMVQKSHHYLYLNLKNTICVSIRLIQMQEFSFINLSTKKMNVNTHTHKKKGRAKRVLKLSRSNPNQGPSLLSMFILTNLTWTASKAILILVGVQREKL